MIILLLISDLQELVLVIDETYMLSLPFMSAQAWYRKIIFDLSEHWLIDDTGQSHDPCPRLQTNGFY